MACWPPAHALGAELPRSAECQLSGIALNDRLWPVGDGSLPCFASSSVSIGFGVGSDVMLFRGGEGFDV